MREIGLFCCSVCLEGRERRKYSGFSGTATLEITSKSAILPTRENSTSGRSSARRVSLVFTCQQVVQAAFERWRSECSDASPDALVFANPKTGRPLWAGGWLRNHVKPIAQSLGITVPVTFQVLRRSCATRNQKHGSLKDVQAHLRHGNIGTTGDVYMMEIPDSVAQMVELDVADVLGRIQ